MSVLALCPDCPTIICVVAEWCGHCRKFKPVVEWLQKHAEEHRRHVLVLEETNVKHQPMIKALNVHAFPTVMVAHFPTREIRKYHGPLTKEAILASYGSEPISTNVKIVPREC